jgi:hypothetical protein
MYFSQYFQTSVSAFNVMYIMLLIIYIHNITHVLGLRNVYRGLDVS